MLAGDKLSTFEQVWMDASRDALSASVRRAKARLSAVAINVPTTAMPGAGGVTMDAVRSQVRTSLAHGQLMLQRLDGEIAQVAWLNRLQAQSRIPRLYIFLAVVASAFAFLFLGFCAPFFRRVGLGHTCTHKIIAQCTSGFPGVAHARVLKE